MRQQAELQHLMAERVAWWYGGQLAWQPLSLASVLRCPVQVAAAAALAATWGVLPPPLGSSLDPLCCCCRRRKPLLLLLLQATATALFPNCTLATRAAAGAQLSRLLRAAATPRQEALLFRAFLTPSCAGGFNSLFSGDGYTFTGLGGVMSPLGGWAHCLAEHRAWPTAAATA